MDHFLKIFIGLFTSEMSTLCIYKKRKKRESEQMPVTIAAS